MRKCILIKGQTQSLMKCEFTLLIMKEYQENSQQDPKSECTNETLNHKEKISINMILVHFYIFLENVSIGN